MSDVTIIRSRLALRRIVHDWKQAGLTVGVVPTMGALHDGHLSLVRHALAETDRVVVTLFVNPRQFNNAEDLAAYPRTEADDAQKLAPLGAHILYVPGVEDMYPTGFATTVSVDGVSRGLCGDTRPGHFDGVATVVAKLFLQTGADVAFFGEKDFQQLLVVRRMAQDLDIPVRIVACPTVRESDGLAMSSRNRRLTAQQRVIASALPRILFAAADSLAAGGDAAPVLATARQALQQAGFGDVDYLELRDAATLEPRNAAATACRLFIAAWLGPVRLIDNVPVLPDGQAGSSDALERMQNPVTMV